MAKGNESIVYSTILATAKTIDAQNEAINSALKRSKSAVESLSATWTGSAADTTINAYKTFAEKYSAQYQAWLTEYSQFLVTAAAEHEVADNEAMKNASAFDGI